ncbi:hypothetical protein CBS14141_002881 [Malassezia furfur]|nr:hypothetical protein CBS14141_002881 [Malassezia furfur]
MDMRSSMPVAPSPMQAALPASSPPADDIVQPSKEWVLPARGKPGRKPAAEVPLTKRKAQNRASQRAFRERRHAYLTELEEKVARYEAREIDANVQMQRIALQCREEATMLRQKNEALMARCEQLEQQLKALATSTPRTDARSPSGCLPPKHEVGASPARDAPHFGASPGAFAVRRPSAPGTGASAPTPTHTLSQLTKTLRDTDSPSDPDEIGFDCGFCRTSRCATPTTAPSPRARAPNAPTPCSGDQRMCGACQEDPTLAEFCSAVTRSVQVPTSTQRKTPGPGAAYSPTATAPSPGAPRESIPQAFTRLRSHPNFGQWKGNGGLQMLADVISRDAKDKDAPPAPGASGSASAPGAPGPADAPDAPPAPENARSAPATIEPMADAPSDAPNPKRAAPETGPRTARPSSDARTTSSSSPPPAQPAPRVRRAASDTSPDADAEAARQKARQGTERALALLDRPDAQEAPAASAASPPASAAPAASAASPAARPRRPHRRRRPLHRRAAAGPVPARGSTPRRGCPGRVDSFVS